MGKEDVDDVPKGESTQFAQVFGVALLVLGAAQILVQIPLWLESGTYLSLYGPNAEVGSALASQLILPFYLVIPSVFLIIGGILAVYGGQSKSRPPVYAAMCLTFPAAAISIGIGLSLVQTLDALELALESNPIESDFSALELDAMDFTAAIYNECCLPLYDSTAYNSGDGALGQLIRDGDPTDTIDLNQRAVEVCGDNVADTCPIVENNGVPPMFPAVLSTTLETLDFGEAQEFLCHCITDEAKFDDFVDIFQRDDSCNAFRSAVVSNVDDIELPVLGVTFNLVINTGLGLTNAEIADELPMGEFAIVGKMLPPGSVYGEAEENIGWSCGLGYAKSIAFYLDLYIKRTTEPTVYGSMVVSGVAAGLSVLLIVMWALGCDSAFEPGDDGYEDIEDDYNNVPDAVVVKKKVKAKKKKAVEYEDEDEDEDDNYGPPKKQVRNNGSKAEKAKAEKVKAAAVAEPVAEAKPLAKDAPDEDSDLAV